MDVEIHLYTLALIHKESESTSNRTKKENHPLKDPECTASERQERRAAGVIPQHYGAGKDGWQAAFRQYLGLSPQVGPYDRDKRQVAIGFLARIRAVMEMQANEPYDNDRAVPACAGDGEYTYSLWTPSERGRLWRMEQVWARRARGVDAGYNLWGTQGNKGSQRGRLSARGMLQAVECVVKEEADWRDKKRGARRRKRQTETGSVTDQAHNR